MQKLPKWRWKQKYEDALTVILNPTVTLKEIFVNNLFVIVVMGTFTYFIK